MAQPLWILEGLLATGGLGLAAAGHARLALLALPAMVLLALVWPLLAALLGDADPGDAPPPIEAERSPEKAEALAQIDARIAEQRAAVQPTPAPGAALARVLKAQAAEALEDHRRGLEAERAGRWAEAEACYSRAVAAAPGWAEAEHGLMRAVFEQGELARAVALCSMMQGRSPEPLGLVPAEELLAWTEDERQAHIAQFQAVLESQMRMVTTAQLEGARSQFLKA